ncbi:MAG: NAD(P)-dependent oxidoreductase [Deltaproteobacteria bacterium]|nr:NAD(P)-dependent oxidoreductase [Deltaproteobacteria bacterium]
MLIKTVGILSLGEMGAQWASVLSSYGVRICTCTRGRSPRTLETAQRCGAIEMEKIEALVEASDLIVSLVPADASLEVGRGVAQAMKSTGIRPLFLEANAISPARAEEIAGLITLAGGDCVDAGVIGAASQLAQGTFTVLSGPRAHELEALGLLGLSVEVVGDKVGQASALKMLNAGLFHGLTTLMLELLFGAGRLGIQPQVLRLYARRSPGLFKQLRPLIETTRRHAGRRSHEMAELLETFATVGFSPHTIAAGRDILSEIARMTSPQATEWNETISKFAEFKPHRNPPD